MRLLMVALLFSSTIASAYPISPQTIWELTWQSELIVVAQVDDVGSRLFSKKDWASDVAVLRPLETWKGVPEDEVEVAFSGSVICPAPPQYDEGRVVLAFLRRVDGDWHTTGLSYGTRYFESGTELAEYREAVRDAIRAQGSLTAPPGEESEPRPPVAERGWALARAERRATRWDGLYALSFTSDPYLSHYDRKRERTGISDAERERLAEVFLRAPSFDQTLVMMLRVLEQNPNPEITRVAAEAFEMVMANEIAPWWADEAIEALRTRLTNETRSMNPSTDPLAEEFERVTKFSRSASEREEKYQHEWDALKAKHQLQPAHRPDYRKKKSSGTGGDTPP